MYSQFRFDVRNAHITKKEDGEDCSSPSFVRQVRLELTQANAHYPLKVACLPFHHCRNLLWDCKIKYNYEIRKNILISLPKFLPMLQLEVPGGAAEVLLHSCCAPCSGAVVECLLGCGIRPVVFFSNSNIVPYEEYLLRKSELKRYCRSLGVETAEDEYDHAEWLRNAAPSSTLQAAPERGPRCLRCFSFRLRRAAAFAAGRGIPVLTTTLASSRWKSLEQVDEAGRAACEGTGVIWWGQNWRKGGLQPRRAEIIREQNFYNQNWCGCEFSRRLADVAG